MWARRRRWLCWVYCRRFNGPRFRGSLDLVASHPLYTDPMKTLFLILFAIGGIAWAQTSTPPPLAPELAPIAAKHKSDFAAVETQKKTALARAQHDYVTALDFADKAAGSAGDLKGVVAIGKERDLAKAKPDLALSFPADLPAALRPSRKVYLDAIASANADAQKREDQIDSDYLRTLTMLDSHAAANPSLGPQIAAEKAEIIRRATAAPPGTAAAAANVAPAPAANGKPAATPEPVLAAKLMNGNFEEVDASGLPTGWKLDGSLDKGGVLPDGVSIKAIKENGISFLRMTFDGRFHDCGIAQEIAVPNRARTATFKVWYRGKVAGQLNPAQWPGCGVRFYNEKGQRNITPGGYYVWAEKMMHQASFKTFEKKVAIPDGAIKAELYLINWNCNGVFDFEHAELTFK